MVIFEGRARRQIRSFCHLAGASAYREDRTVRIFLVSRSMYSISQLAREIHLCRISFEIDIDCISLSESIVLMVGNIRGLGERLFALEVEIIYYYKHKGS